MKKYIKSSIIIGIIVALFFLIKSRRVSQSTFDLMVLVAQNEVLETCNNRLKAKQNDNNISFDNLNYGDKYYNYYLSKYGNSICSNSEKLKNITIEHNKKFFREQWKFIY